MKLYNEAMPAPNPRRVRMFMAEKGIDIPLVHVPMRERAHKAPDYLAKNPLGQLPSLELDDGSVISESVSICRYLESLHPEPPLFGRGARQQAEIDMWVRRVEFQLMTPIGQIWRHTHPITAKLLTQYRDFGESNRELAERAFRWLDRELEGRDYIAGEAFSMADIIAISTVDFGSFIGVEPPADCANLIAWRERVSARPSAAA